jgi:hypothetical protein
MTWEEFKPMFIEASKRSVELYGADGILKRYGSPAGCIDNLLNTTRTGLPFDIEEAKTLLIQNRKEAEEIVAGLLGLM